MDTKAYKPEKEHYGRKYIEETKLKIKEIEKEEKAIYLKKYREEKDNIASIPELFYVEGEPIGKGGSCVCYNAYKENMEVKILKEFYPLDSTSSDTPVYYDLQRRSDNHLVASDSFDEGKENFRKAKETFLSSYDTIKKIGVKIEIMRALAILFQILKCIVHVMKKEMIYLIQQYILLVIINN